MQANEKLFIFCTSHSFSAADPQSDVLDEDKIRYNDLVKKGKELGRKGHLERALNLFEKAYEILESEKLLRKIERVKVSIKLYFLSSKLRYSTVKPYIIWTARLVIMDSVTLFGLPGGRGTPGSLFGHGCATTGTLNPFPIQDHVHCIL